MSKETEQQRVERLVRTLTDVTVGLAAVETARGVENAGTLVGSVLLFVLVQYFPQAKPERLHEMLDEALANR